MLATLPAQHLGEHLLSNQPLCLERYGKDARNTADNSHHTHRVQPPNSLLVHCCSPHVVAGDKIQVSLSVENSGNVWLLYKAALVRVGTSIVTLDQSICKSKVPTATLVNGESNKLECTFDYTITQDDIESPDYLQTYMKFEMLYYTCPAKDDSCRQAVSDEDSGQSVQLPKTVEFTNDITVSSSTYNAAGGEHSHRVQTLISL